MFSAEMFFYGNVFGRMFSVEMFSVEIMFSGEKFSVEMFSAEMFFYGNVFCGNVFFRNVFCGNAMLVLQKQIFCDSVLLHMYQCELPCSAAGQRFST